jgi:tetratricopeptide (TPR) repeat protein
VTFDRLPDDLRAALAAARDPASSAADRADMLVEMAMALQLRPRTPDHLLGAVELYDEALALCPAEDALFAARITARKGTALQAVPEPGTQCLERARDAYERAIPVLREAGDTAELAEAEMNLGLVLQSLAAAGRARLVDAIAAYQRALTVFERERYPVEYAILQNNLATAFLSMPLTDERAAMREALAVQSFEAALEVVTLIDHPSEYAMLQNNLGNALQYAPSAHPAENCLRALDAYDEALKVRSRATTPLEYANTIANKANCLWNLAGDLAEVRGYYAEAHDIFAANGETEKAALVADALLQLDHELQSHLLSA